MKIISMQNLRENKIRFVNATHIENLEATKLDTVLTHYVKLPKMKIDGQLFNCIRARADEGNVRIGQRFPFLTDTEERIDFSVSVEMFKTYLSDEDDFSQI